MSTHVVLKRIPGVKAVPGTEVDATEWRNAFLLEKQRYLKPLDAMAEPLIQAQAEVNLDERVIEIVTREVQKDGPLADAIRTLIAPTRVDTSATKRANKS
jgi:hypothetical protein